MAEILGYSGYNTILIQHAMTEKIKLVTTNGKTWNAYYADKTAWPEGAYHDDCEISVTENGVEIFAELGIVPNEACMVIRGGVVISADCDSQDLCKHFSTWLEKQTFAFGVFKVPKDRLEAVAAAIVAAGGSVL